MERTKLTRPKLVRVLTGQPSRKKLLSLVGLIPFYKRDSYLANIKADNAISAILLLCAHCQRKSCKATNCPMSTE